MSSADLYRLLCALRAAGVEQCRIHWTRPEQREQVACLLAHIRALGMRSDLVCDGRGLDGLLRTYGGHIDRLTLRLDTCEANHTAMLDGSPGRPVDHAIVVASMVKWMGADLHLNTQVTVANCYQDMSEWLMCLAPSVWHLRQRSTLAGTAGDESRQTKGHIDCIQFRSFVERHRHLETEGIEIQTGSRYGPPWRLPLDAAGRLFAVCDGRYRVSAPVLDVGVLAAVKQLWPV